MLAYRPIDRSCESLTELRLLVQNCFLPLSLIFVCAMTDKRPLCTWLLLIQQSCALATASDSHRQVPTYMADIRHDWLTNQNMD